MGEEKKLKTKSNCSHDTCVPNNKTTYSSKERCPKCKKESQITKRKIREYLNKKEITFRDNLQIKTFRSKHKEVKYMNFSFEVIDSEDSKKTLIIIDYISEDNYELDHKGRRRGVKETEYLKQIKKDYCYKNAIPLLEISYSDINQVGTILSTEIKQAKERKKKLAVSEYRGIKLDNSIVLYLDVGVFNQKVKIELDILAERLNKYNHKLLSPYSKTTPITINLGCHHGDIQTGSGVYQKTGGCPKCKSEERRNKLTPCYRNFMRTIENNGHMLLSEYRGKFEQVRILYACGHDVETTPEKHNSGSKCEKCGVPWVQSAELSFVELVERNGHELCNEYSGERSEVKVKFECYHPPTWVSPSYYRKYPFCSSCKHRKLSKGERKIEKYLYEKGIFESKDFKVMNEHSVRWCKEIEQLRFDFAIFPKGDIHYRSPILMIEFQGEQHYKAVKHWGGEEGFKDRQMKDQMKRDFCHKYNIPLIEIPHWDFDRIEEILDKAIKRYMK